MRLGLVVLVLSACHSTSPSAQLDIDSIHVTNNARLRTDTVGDGTFARESAFVLVDAENTAGQGAYVTLGGALTDASGKAIGTLRPQSLFIPAHDSRTYALVDAERTPRPESTSATIEVRSATIPKFPPPATIEEFHQFPDGDHVIVQAYVVNTAERIGQITVIASFHDQSGKPQTRPFNVIPLGPHDKQTVQYIGPPGSVRGQIYVGEVLY